MTPNFRYDISFLRVIAVVSVILFHYQFNFFKGGFIGVDIFFVISGYLMTAIILKGFDQKTFGLLDFYKKRVIRIFPELLVLLIVFGGIIYLFLPTQFLPYSKSSFSSSLFFSNISYYLNSGYFDQASHRNFLLHTWSLSVEWQFYMVYPLLLLLIKKFVDHRKKIFQILFLILLVISFVDMIYSQKADSSYAFYMSTTRGWEMLMGGLAFIYQKNTLKFSNRNKGVLLILAYITIGYFIVNAGSYDWPSMITLLPVSATAVIIALNYDFKVYRNQILKYTGDLSYSLYLYHWPFFVLSAFLGLHVKLSHRLVFLFISILFALTSYHLIGKRSYKNKSIFILAFAGIICVGSIIILKINPNYYYKDIGNLVASVNYKDSEETKVQYNLGTKHVTGEMKFSDYNLNQLSIPKNNKKTIVLLGDSHAGMFAKTLQNIGNDLDANIIQITTDATYPMPNSKSRYQVSEDLFNYAHYQYFPKNRESIDLVILSVHYFDHEDDILKKIKFSEDYFKKLKIPLLFIGQTDKYMNDFPTSNYVKEHYGLENTFQNQLTRKNLELNDQLKKSLGDQYIDLSKEKIQYISKENIPYIYDSHHLTYYGAECYKKLIKSHIESVFTSKK